MEITGKIEIYINLLEEGITVMRATTAEIIGEGICRILPTPNYNPEDEKWEFLPGTIVKYKTSKTDEGLAIWVATSNDPETQDRIELLNKIIKYQDVSDSIFQYISLYPWDYTGQPTLISANDISYVLNLYIEQKTTSVDIEKWANFLECRDDVDADKIISEIIFELANPDVQGALTVSRAKSILLSL